MGSSEPVKHSITRGVSLYPDIDVRPLWQPVGTAGAQWLNEQDKKLAPHGPAKPTDSPAENCLHAGL